VAHAHDDAVGGRAAHGERALVDGAHAQRLVQGERVAGAGLVGLGRHDPDVVGELLRDLAQSVQAGRVDTVVVGEEDAHGGTVSDKIDAVAMRGSRE
jgi:hypothetical protein